MNGFGIFFLIVIGIGALILEFLVVPGGIVGIIGGLFMIAGVVLTYINYGAVWGNITLLATLIFTVVAIVLMLRSRTWKKLMLNTNIDSKMNEIDENKIKVGMVGTSISRLAPSGKGKFDDEVVEVFSMHEFIDENKEIVIIKIEGNKIIVKLN